MADTRLTPLGGLGPDAFSWRISRPFDWSGSQGYTIELEELEGCLSYGSTIREAKKGLTEALGGWVRKHGERALPEVEDGAQIIYLEPPMSIEEFDWINDELRVFAEKTIRG
ncbi:type II toxin-antitoxin system HicB family antitoxin [Halalkalibacterium halodurans]|uniref:BH3266 protein n=2 Tax=Halalkalibacterium halodurans TaxID=86665 RepID=Q9K7U3_HALH5|nr:type II toxin-antitoxin system HicB family antitoxin [Halalkalibacterium halodurans]MDY7223798.1 type II toxin-antitoxin system HicB family antitoxin [Halalkalibacterium halodurans]MDY7243019.1 type II toxin-antitoxin system HicB family antitoxin [Halalkalibacterium halodurans]MED3645974.1 type II toxin-antitoxin system HicB family antitoxin [Halalkalibacterium halodurans]MED4079982.1 type II toxin-antitoxin system HicB family antitoxin [Halalkalibacterium halodurans]MED4084446.1 type II to